MRNTNKQGYRFYKKLDIILVNDIDTSSSNSANIINCLILYYRATNLQ